jgi:hypothetical protein
MKKIMIAAAALLPLLVYAGTHDRKYLCGFEPVTTVPAGNPAHCIVTSPMPAANWSLLRTGNLLRLFYDKTTIKPFGKSTKVWILWAQEKGDWVAGEVFWSYKELLYVDCTAGTYGTKQQIFYSDEIGNIPISNGGLVTDDPKVQFMDMSPGSMGQAIIDTVCAMRQRRGM